MAKQSQAGKCAIYKDKQGNQKYKAHKKLKNKCAVLMRNEVI